MNESALFRTLKRMIELGKTQGLEDRIDVLYAAGKLTDEEYNTLIAMLHPTEGESETE